MVESSRKQAQNFIKDNDDFDLSKTDDADYSSALLSKVPNKGHVLDAGCGSGRNITVLQQHFKHITLLEQKADALKQAKKIAGKYLSQAVRVKIQDLQLTELTHEFDCVFIHCVMGYLSNVQFVNFLKTIRHKLAKGGTIVLRENINDGTSNEK